MSEKKNIQICQNGADSNRIPDRIRNIELIWANLI